MEENLHDTVNTWGGGEKGGVGGGTAIEGELVWQSKHLGGRRGSGGGTALEGELAQHSQEHGLGVQETHT